MSDTERRSHDRHAEAINPKVRRQDTLLVMTPGRLVYEAGQAHDAHA